VRRVYPLTNQDVFVIEGFDVHRASNVLTGGQTEPKGALQVSLRQRWWSRSHARWQIAKRVDQGSIDSICELEPLFVVVGRAIVRPDIDVDEPPEIDTPIRDHGAK